MPALTAILSQTVSDFELILVDDGSRTAAAPFATITRRGTAGCRVIHQENQGQAAARNRALAVAKGEWVCFVDSDDAVHPQMLERLGQAAAESGAAMSMCRMLEAPEMPEDFSSPVEVSWELLSMEEESLVALFDAGDYPGWVACAKLIRRELVQSHLFCPGRVYEDNEAVCHWIYGAKTVASIPTACIFTAPIPTAPHRAGFP